ncbi:MAG: aldehyde dehydrogenase family protein [Boseongicola sp. SB0670_bin_30]|nr:aldehyde dehydrogenase family protein [Boseongicola sp. SB0670_bin_30]
MWRGADGGAAIVVTIPATGDVPGHVPDCSAGESDRGIADASQAFEDWSRRDLSNRVGLLPSCATR